jgi:hypothetical protein
MPLSNITDLTEGFCLFCYYFLQCLKHIIGMNLGSISKGNLARVVGVLWMDILSPEFGVGWCLCCSLRLLSIITNLSDKYFEFIPLFVSIISQFSFVHFYLDVESDFSTVSVYHLINTFEPALSC